MDNDPKFIKLKLVLILTFIFQWEVYTKAKLVPHKIHPAKLTILSTKIIDKTYHKHTVDIEVVKVVNNYSTQLLFHAN